MSLCRSHMQSCRKRCASVHLTKRMFRLENRILLQDCKWHKYNWDSVFFSRLTRRIFIQDQMNSQRMSGGTVCPTRLHVRLVKSPPEDILDPWLLIFDGLTCNLAGNAVSRLVCRRHK